MKKRVVRIESDGGDIVVSVLEERFPRFLRRPVLKKYYGEFTGNHIRWFKDKHGGPEISLSVSDFLTLSLKERGIPHRCRPLPLAAIKKMFHGR